VKPVLEVALGSSRKKEGQLVKLSVSLGKKTEIAF
jgi:hypothetical protein